MASICYRDGCGEVSQILSDLTFDRNNIFDAGKTIKITYK